MAELREVEVKRLQPNPFRDGGSGTATWESVAEAYGFDEAKLKELEASYRINGCWPGIIVREAETGWFQLAFGHHRVEAARRMGLKRLTVIVDFLSDAQMLTMMANENSEEYGHDFALGVMNAVEAVVKAYGAGKVELEPVSPKTTSSVVRTCPGGSTRTYTATTLAKYLGWTCQDPKASGGVGPQDRVKTAISALDLLELGALRRVQLKGLGSTQARELVTLTRRNMEAAAARIEVKEDFLLKEKSTALKDGDKNKAAKIERAIAILGKNKVEEVKKAGKAAATTVVDFHAKRESFSEALRAAQDVLQVPKTQPKKSEQIVDFKQVDALTGKLDDLLLEGDSNWERVMLLTEQTRNKKPFRELADAMDSLRERCKARAAELRKKAGL